MASRILSVGLPKLTADGVKGLRSFFIRAASSDGYKVESRERPYTQSMPLITRAELFGGAFLRAFVLVCVLVGCTKVVPIDSAFPSPIIESLPLVIGIHYDEAFRTYVHEEEALEGGTWVIELGSANVALYDHLFNSMFEHVTPVTEFPPESGEARGVDAIIKPQVEGFTFVTPGPTGSTFVEVSIRYRFTLYSPRGEFLSSWALEGYGRSHSRLFKAALPLEEATTLAMRDAAAVVAIEFKHKPEVKALLRAKRTGTGSAPDGATF